MSRRPPQSQPPRARSPRSTAPSSPSTPRQATAPDLQVRLVNARHGKALRAEPVAHLFEAGKVRLHGRLPELEAQLLGMIAGGGYEGPGTSPDRADAMVWGVGEVMKTRGAGVRSV